MMVLLLCLRATWTARAKIFDRVNNAFSGIPKQEGAIYRVGVSLTITEAIDWTNRQEQLHFEYLAR